MATVTVKSWPRSAFVDVIVDGEFIGLAMQTADDQFMIDYGLPTIQGIVPLAQAILNARIKYSIHRGARADVISHLQELLGSIV